ncbi:uncharacterized protein LOC131303025 [Rhododendron vialii]|uniref:uncharacterized protein LOC131303025 n=1 Tax=Rhododendron vialii TaxID=182163 RepID=UPI00265E489B|nr:uncharacterized protein LOC131303025 [Rhododendron vialii]
MKLVATEERKCRQFKKGLHDTVKRLVVAQRKGRFADVIECARSIEIPNETPKNPKVWEPGQPGVSNKPPIVCHECGQAGHIRAQCPLLLGTCFTCGKAGHFGWNCPCGDGAHSESGSVQQLRDGQSSS